MKTFFKRKDISILFDKIICFLMSKFYHVFFFSFIIILCNTTLLFKVLSDLESSLGNNSEKLLNLVFHPDISHSKF